MLYTYSVSYHIVVVPESNREHQISEPLEHQISEPCLLAGWLLAGSAERQLRDSCWPLEHQISDRRALLLSCLGFC